MKPTIAVVEDNQVFREELCRILNKKEFSVVIEAEHGADLLAQLEKTDAPDLCLCDINMPVMDGFETARQLKRKYPHVKLMIFSTDSSTFNQREALRWGADDFLPKHSTADEYLSRLLGLISS